MNVNGKHYRTVWLNEVDELQIIDQRHLPHKFIIEELNSVDDVARAIKEMHVRGAGCIGATAGYGMYVATKTASKNSLEEFNSFLKSSVEKLKSTRPTAVNLAWAIERQLNAIKEKETIEEKILIAKKEARAIADEDVNFCKKIGEYGVKIIKEIYEKKQSTVNILTHCNAGWLAFVNYGSATAPIYEAQKQGIPIQVWVDETRPRNQGAR
jgi:methylthioribose-1-phosphate isomerase